MQQWQALEQVLHLEVDLLTQAVALGERKRQALVANNVTDLEVLIREETELAGKLQEVELQLTRTVGSLAGQYGSTNLAELIDLQHCPVREALRPLYERMVILMATLQAISEQNKLLIEQALSYIDFSLRVYLNAQQEPSYTAAGTTRNRTNPRLLDRKI